MIFENFGEKRKSAPPHQATPTDDSVSMSRRQFIKRVGLFVAGAVVGEHESEKLLKKAFPVHSQVPSHEEGHASTRIPKTQNEKPAVKSAAKDVPEPPVHFVSEKSSESQHESSSEIAEEHSPLDAYSFLDGQKHPKEVSTGSLSGSAFSGLYPMYLGIPSGTVVPEILNVDFKENLAALWRKKFKLPARSHNEHIERGQLRFLKEHHDLMNLAEYLYRSYNAEKPNTMTLDTYRNNINDSVKKSHTVFAEALEHKLASGTGHGVFSEEQLSLMGDMGQSLTADTLLALSFTELMPLDDGDTNARVFDFLLRNAGVDFIDRIPSVYDMLESFGPYQITPDALSPKSAGSWAVQVLGVLPSGFMPWNVDELLRGKENIAAYTLAMLNIAQFVGTRNPTQLRCLSDVMRALSTEQRAKAVLSFVAAAHHSPHEACDAFDAFVWSMYAEKAHSFHEEDVLRHIPTKDLREYTGKALANYRFLASGAPINDSI